MPNLAKTTAAAALSWSGMSAWVGRKSRALPLVLGYHRVVASGDAMSARTLPGMTISQGMLRAQLEWVGRRFRFVSLDQLGEKLERGEPCGDLAAVTFDDGYRDVRDHALPVLQQMGVSAAVFVVSSLVGTSSPPLHDQLYQLVSESFATKRRLPAPLAKRLNGYQREPHAGPGAVLRAVRMLLELPAADLRGTMDELRVRASWMLPPSEVVTLDWEALASMQRAGMTIGSHTDSHAVLTREDDESVLRELQRSRSTIEERLGVPVHHLAYPDGGFSPRVVRAVASAGYRFAYTICDHRDREKPLLTIPRVMLWEASCRGSFDRFSPSLMQCHASSVLPFSSPCRGDHGEESRAKS